MKLVLLTACVGVLAAGLATNVDATDLVAQGTETVPRYATAWKLRNATSTNHEFTAEASVAATAELDPRFAGHFPGAPTMPGVALVDLVAMAAGHWAASTPTATSGRDLLELSGVRFRSYVRPGNRLRVNLQRISHSDSKLEVEGSLAIVGAKTPAIEITKLAVGDSRTEKSSLRRLEFEPRGIPWLLSDTDRIAASLPHGKEAVHLDQATLWLGNDAVWAEGTTKLHGTPQRSWLLELPALLAAVAGQRLKGFNVERDITALVKLVQAEFSGRAQQDDVVRSRIIVKRHPIKTVSTQNALLEASVGRRPLLRASIQGMRFKKRTLLGLAGSR